MLAQRLVFPALALLVAGVAQAAGCDPAIARQLDR
jgi:hypothetical protein